MDDIVETFEIQTSHNNIFVCKMDLMLFLIVVMIIIILLYIIQFKIN
jgi:hypothetical protein